MLMVNKAFFKGLISTQETPDLPYVLAVLQDGCCYCNPPFR